MTGTRVRLRVAQLVETLGAGGAEALAIDIAEMLEQRGYESHLIVVRGEGPFMCRVPPRVHLHDMKRQRPDGNQIERIVDFAGSARHLAAYLHDHRIDVLQTHLPKANFLGLYVATRHRIRTFATAHNNREFDYGDRAGPIRRALRREGYRQMLGRCRGVIAVSAQVKASLVGQLGVSARLADRIHVVPNGVRLAAPAQDGARQQFRQSLGIAEGEVLIVGVGRLTRQKNHARMLEALARIPGSAGRWSCVIAGDGELRSDLQQGIERAGLTGQVRLPGIVDDVRALMAAADIFCLPSLFEGLPLVLLEAMGSGLPTAAFAIDGVTDVLVDGIHGVLAAPDDASSLAMALERLIADPGRRLQMGSAARSLVAQRYDFEAFGDRLESVYAT